MITYDRPLEPQVFVNGRPGAESYFANALSTYGCFTNIPDEEKRAIFALCSDKKTKESLFGGSYQKCVYCELKPGQTGTRETDHFYPKSLHHSRAFDWTNLLPCCRSC